MSRYPGHAAGAHGLVDEWRIEPGERRHLERASTRSASVDRQRGAWRRWHSNPRLRAAIQRTIDWHAHVRTATLDGADMNTLLRDVRFAIRTLRRSPGYTLAALLTLVLGLGANTAVFSVVSGIVLAPLPFTEPASLVRVWEESGSGGRMNSAWRNFVDWRERARSFDALAAHSGGVESTTVLTAGGPLRVGLSSVSDGFFGTLGVTPVVGRPLLPEEHRLGADPAVVVSDGFWRTHLGGDADLSSHRVTVGTFDARVVGVMPPGFEYPGDIDVWYPLELNAQSESRTAHNFAVIGRLASSATVAAADAELDAITGAFLEEDPAAAAEDWFEDYFPRSAAVTSLHDALVGEARRPLWILLGASVLVLLVACTNLASATLARGTGREQEYAVRRSLGAGRGVVIRQLFTESLVLAVAGGILAIVLAAGALRLLPSLAPAGIPRIDEVGLDAGVAAVALVVTLLTAILFGLFPALRLAEGGFGDVLRRGSRTGIERGRHRVWKALVAFEVALALMLLVGSGLLIRSFRTVIGVEPGFRTSGLLTAALNPPASRYGDLEARRGYYDAVLRELSALAGVSDAGLVTSPPLTGTSNGRVDVRGGPSAGASGDYFAASPGYFAALGIPLLRGRLFDETDHENAPHVVVVNRTFAELAWPGDDPVGKQITGGGMDDYWDQDVWATVVGVVGDIRQRSLEREPDPAYFFSYRQRPFRTWSMTAVVRPAGDNAASLATGLRDAVRRIDPNVPVTVSTIETRMSDALTPRRFTVLVLGIFSAVALILACVGIWGVVAYAATRRTREIGIRMALGADPVSVRRLIQRDYLGPAALGAILGLALSLALTRVLQGMLFEVQPTDPATFLAVIAVLAATTWLASFVPSFRGTRITPMETMRAE